MMKALSGAVAWVLHDADAAPPHAWAELRADEGRKEGALSKPQSDAYNS